MIWWLALCVMGAAEGWFGGVFRMGVVWGGGASPFYMLSVLATSKYLPLCSQIDHVCMVHIEVGDIVVSL